MSHYVYALIDPRTNHPFYVGETRDVKSRFPAHRTMKDNNKEKNDKIQEIRMTGFTPEIKVLEHLPSRELCMCQEAYWIKKYQQEGFQLVNNKVINHPRSEELAKVIKNIKERRDSFVKESLPTIRDYPEVNLNDLLDYSWNHFNNADTQHLPFLLIKTVFHSEEEALNRHVCWLIQHNPNKQEAITAWGIKKRQEILDLS